MNVTVDNLLQLLGSQVVEIAILKQQLQAATTKIAELEKSATALKVVEKKE